MRRRPIAIGLTLLVGAIVASLGLKYLGYEVPFLGSTNTAHNSLPGSDRSEPDLSGEGIRFTQYRTDGSTHYQLAATAIEQFNDEGIANLTQPDLNLTSLDGPPWQASAKRGYIREQQYKGNKEEVVYLQDDVILIQTHPKHGTMTMKSNTLFVYPAREYAQTDQDVMIDSPVGRTKAAGLHVDLATGVLNLSSSPKQRVHTIVLPEQFK